MTQPDYGLVIQQAFSQSRLPKHMQEDLTQDCWVSLLEKPDEDPLTVCLKTISRGRDAERPKKMFRKRPKVLSLSDPKIYAQAARVTAEIGHEVTDEKLYGAILGLPEEEYEVLWSLVIEGNTQEQTADKLGMTRDQIRTRKDRGIKMLKKHFEVE